MSEFANSIRDQRDQTSEFLPRYPAKYQEEPTNRALFLIEPSEPLENGSKVISPYDSRTMLPLLIYSTRSDHLLSKRDYHHLRHPKKSEELGYDAVFDHLGRLRFKISEDEKKKVEGKALRYSQGQIVPKYLHSRYHSLFYGSYLPKNRKDKFTGVVLSLAGVAPRTAIDLSEPGEHYLRELSENEFRFLTSPRRMYHEKARGASKEENKAKKDMIGMFFAAYALEQSLKLPQEKFGEFLYARKEKQRKKLAREILNEAIGVSVAELIPIHNEAKEEGMVSKKNSSLGAVVLKFFPETKFADYYGSLEQTARVALS